SFFLISRQLLSTLLPYTTLFRSLVQFRDGRLLVCPEVDQYPHTEHGAVDIHRLVRGGNPKFARHDPARIPRLPFHHFHFPGRPLDRKSTRLNSSHRTISYAVFCL